MKVVPKGKLITIEELKASLAKKQSGLHVPSSNWLLYQYGSRSVEGNGITWQQTVYSVLANLQKDGELNKGYPGGIESQRKMLEKEGHTIVAKGNRYFVKNYRASVCLL